ncbi:MAG: Tm-1-like ATP-binding domain-containing protein [Syntrophaceae bacterium]|nr:Tm-1-like ATP-binding domain-containing protein [Syntrophaceae bacterium]
MNKTIALIATLDTRAGEICYMRDLVEDMGHTPMVIDIGILGEPPFEPDIKREDLLREIGLELSELLALKGQHGRASKVMADALVAKVKKLSESRAVDGAVAIGGGTGSSMVAEALQILPLGFPKVLVSTKAVQAGILEYVGAKDVVIIPSVCDIAGLNRITKKILSNAVSCVVGMVEFSPNNDEFEEKHPVVVQMNGGVTGCGLALKNLLEKDNHEVIIFHGIGPGGRALEDFVRSHDVSCCLELSVCEVGNELFGGRASAGPDRFEAACRKGIPQIIAPGSAEIINFLGPSSIPEKYKGRTFFSHNEQATAMKLNGEEMRTLATVIAEKLNRAKGRTELLIPLKGFCYIDQEGCPFWDPECDEIFIKTLTENISPNVTVFNLDMHINDIEFVDFMYGRFLEITRRSSTDRLIKPR